MSTFKERLFLEKSELDEKIEKLGAFVASDSFSKIDAMQQSLLTIQLPVMRSYSQVLEIRLSLLESIPVT